MARRRKKDARVFTVIRKNLINRVVIEKRSNLIYYPYVIILNIRNLNQKIRLSLKRIKVVNVYDQFIGREYIYLGTYIRRRSAIKNIN